MVNVFPEHIYLSSWVYRTCIYLTQFIHCDKVKTRFFVRLILLLFLLHSSVPHMDIHIKKYGSHNLHIFARRSFGCWCCCCYSTVLIFILFSFFSISITLDSDSHLQYIKIQTGLAGFILVSYTHHQKSIEFAVGIRFQWIFLLHHH